MTKLSLERYYNFKSFFFNNTTTTEIYTLSLHDALPIYFGCSVQSAIVCTSAPARCLIAYLPSPDRKSTRLNSSHGYISYAVFCLKKKKKSKTLLSIHTLKFIKTF